MTNLTSKLAAIVCTVLLSATMLGAAIAPADANSPSGLVKTVRVA